MGRSWENAGKAEMPGPRAYPHAEAVKYMPCIMDFSDTHFSALSSKKRRT